MESSDEPNLRNNNADQFVTTHWSLVYAAGDHECEESNRALERLCRAYWPPLYAYVRRRVNSIHEAQDLTQAFFERLLEKKYLTDADPERGRFRSFLITAFKRFLSKEHDKATAKKRGGSQRTFSVDFESQERNWGILQDTMTAERIYDRQWAVTLLNRVMSRLQREMERSGKSQQFQLLKDFIGGVGMASYSDVASELGISESAARMATSRMRSRYRELLRDEISQTVIAEEDIDCEVQYLFKTFAE
ncbi:sigma-70 family RNA polymerase sigma factor [Rubinisphaera sp.]|uniref:RNA polymerase sigma factor n=1 Tax=Rubinisphaera sp. TaxID=2024857 RepID=UPI0025FE8989|nr:sigma-70 family RNA polymerase sigma factor [Rubinisphaera sp.]|tara:strand:- start:456 stop:1199 length:744 start_codon:yes stop_codon:yes gene_type:complete